MLFYYFGLVWCAGFCAWDVSKGEYGWAVFFAFLALYNLIMCIKES